jgi:hypothetical protein
MPSKRVVVGTKVNAPFAEHLYRLLKSGIRSGRLNQAFAWLLGSSGSHGHLRRRFDLFA